MNKNNNHPFTRICKTYTSIMLTTPLLTMQIYIYESNNFTISAAISKQATKAIITISTAEITAAATTTASAIIDLSSIFCLYVFQDASFRLCGDEATTGNGGGGGCRTKGGGGSGVEGGLHLPHKMVEPHNTHRPICIEFLCTLGDVH